MKVLVVDSDSESRDALRRAFSAAGCSVRGFPGLDEAVRALDDFDPEIVVAALDALDGDPEAFLSQARARDARRATYVVVDASGLESAVEALARGADDFLWRPISPERVRQIVSKAAARRERNDRVEETRVRLARAELRDALPGRSARWVAALAALERAAQLPGSVLLTGECGTEKDEAALALHRLSPRGAEPFSYISEGESLDLATRQTESGALFLSNVEATSSGFQELLLAHVRGPRRTRFIVSIDEDPRDALEAGRLMRTLHEALSENTVHLPPLRERGRGRDAARPAFSGGSGSRPLARPGRGRCAARDDWPGNTHELKEVVRRAARLSESTIGPTVVRSVIGRPAAAGPERPPPEGAGRSDRRGRFAGRRGAPLDLQDARVRSLTAGALASAPTRSSRRSARAGWARCTGRGTRSSSATSRSRCCRSPLAADPDALARFEREAKAVAALSHPNILSIFDFGTQDGIAYAVMELLEGETLRGKLDAGPIPQKQAVDYALQIAKGLSAAHEKGIVHRDLKPENLFVTKGRARQDPRLRPGQEGRAGCPGRGDERADGAPATRSPGR